MNRASEFTAMSHPLAQPRAMRAPAGPASSAMVGFQMRLGQASLVNLREMGDS